MGKPHYRTSAKAALSTRQQIIAPLVASSPSVGGCVTSSPGSQIVPIDGSARAGSAVGRSRAKAESAPHGLRATWVDWLSPHFHDNESCYFTGTYSDDYGVPNGLMAARNVHKDWKRYLESFGYEGKYIVAVEKHLYRDVLHLHGILAGPFTDEQRTWLKRWWAADRGHCKALPVLDGCESYITKYALKTDTDCFEWRLS